MSALLITRIWMNLKKKKKGEIFPSTRIDIQGCVSVMMCVEVKTHPNFLALSMSNNTYMKQTNTRRFQYSLIPHELSPTSKLPCHLCLVTHP